MKVIIAGPRTFCKLPRRESKDYEAAKLLYDEEYSLLLGFISELNGKYNVVIREVVSGAAEGADQAGERWAEDNRVPVKRFRANWVTHGKSAGIKRNLEMGLYADCAIVVIKDKSKGSTMMANYMRKLGKLVLVKEIG